jgi:hypothetical protein
MQAASDETILARAAAEDCVVASAGEPNLLTHPISPGRLFLRPPWVKTRLPSGEQPKPR